MNVNGVTSRENGNYVLPFSLFRPAMPCAPIHIVKPTLKVWRSRRKSLSLLRIFFISQVPLTALTILTAGSSRAAARTMCVDEHAVNVPSISSVVPENAAEILVVQRTAAIARPVFNAISESAARIMSAGRRAQMVDVEKTALIARTVLNVTFWNAARMVNVRGNVTIGAVEKTAPIARTVLSVILVNVARMVNVTRNVTTVAVEKTAIFARTVRSATLVNAVKIATVLRNAQMVDVEKTATLAHLVRSAILASVVTQITPVNSSVLIPASLGQQLQGLLSPV